jgi:hypothetical protein
MIGYGLSWDGVEAMKAAGFTSFGSHSLNHDDVAAYVAAHGTQSYVDNNIIPYQSLIDEHGIRPKNFIYPYGGATRHTPETDAMLLDYYMTVRYFMGNQTINTTNEFMYKFNGNRTITGLMIDCAASTGATLSQVEYIGENYCKPYNEVAILSSHNITASDEDGSGVSWNKLRSILEYAKNNGLHVYTMDEITPDPGTEYTISANKTTVTESDTQIQLTATRTALNGFLGFLPNSSVNIATVPGTASSPGDYTALNTVITLNESGTQTTVLSIKYNVDNKPPKTFTVALSNPTGNATLGSPSSVEITIVNQFVGSTDEPGSIGILIAFIAAILGIFPAIVNLIMSAGILAVVTILAGVLFTFIAKLKLDW